MNKYCKIGINYFLLLTLFVMMMYASHLISKNVIFKNSIESIETLKNEGSYPHAISMRLSVLDNFTDALMFNIIVSADTSHPLHAAMSNNFHTSFAENYDNLATDAMKTAKEGVIGMEEYSYATYWHGGQSILRPLLYLFNYSQIRIINFILMGALLLINLCLIANRINPFVSIAFALSLIGVNIFIIPLSMQYSPTIYIALLSTIYICTHKDSLSQIGNFLCLFFTIGGLTSFFDLLTTPIITIGLPLIIYLLYTDNSRKIRLIFLSSLIWIAGYASLWASKWLIGSIVLGSNIFADAKESILQRSSTLCHGVEMTIPYLLKRLWIYLESSNHLWILWLGIIFLSVIAYFFFKVSKSKEVIKSNLFLLLVAMMPLVWFIVLRNHSIQHYWFTWRSSLVTIFALLIFFGYTIDTDKLKTFISPNKLKKRQ